MNALRDPGSHSSKPSMTQSVFRASGYRTASSWSHISKSVDPSDCFAPNTFEISTPWSSIADRLDKCCPQDIQPNNTPAVHFLSSNLCQCWLRGVYLAEHGLQTMYGVNLLAIVRFEEEIADISLHRYFCHVTIDERGGENRLSTAWVGRQPEERGSIRQQPVLVSRMLE